MIWLILGLLLWAGAHFFKRLAPAARARMGKAGKAAVALVLLLALYLMIEGYQAAPADPLYSSPAWLRGINNLLMLFSVYLFAVSGAKTALHRYTRHPMLWGTVVWASAHLLVNGDLPSLVLFGGLLAWALAEMVVINRSEPDWQPPAPRGRAAEIRAVVIALVVYALIAGIHTWLGYFPFG